MFLVGIISWWYGKGWITRVKIARERFRMTSDFFSIGLLLKTLFNLYRQISSEGAGNSLGDKIRAFFDRLLSRIIGAIVRSCTIILGIIVITIQFVFGILTLVFWLIVPLLPIVGLVLFALGWSLKWLV